MPETVILHPLNASESSTYHAEAYEKITSCLNEIKQTDNELDFNDFLAHLGVNYDTYILIIRSTLTRAKVFFKALRFRKQNK